MRRYGFHGLNYAYIAAQLPSCWVKLRKVGSLSRTSVRCQLCLLQD